MLLFFVISCKSQDEINSIKFNKVDLELNDIYQEYYNDRVDFGHEKDSLLPLFESKLKATLSKNEFYGMAFSALTETKQVNTVTSKDEKLHIYSWDTFNMGSWKIYNSMYQYKNDNELYTGFLSEKDASGNNFINFSDGFHFEIYDVDKNIYLVKGNGTHGRGQEFYTMRLLEFRNGKLQDCKACFDGEDRLVFHKPRREEGTINYNPETKEISYLEYIEVEGAGGIRPTGRTITIVYKDGKFIK